MNSGMTRRTQPIDKNGVVVIRVMGLRVGARADFARLTRNDASAHTNARQSPYVLLPRGISAHAGTSLISMGPRSLVALKLKDSRFSTMAGRGW